MEHLRDHVRVLRIGKEVSDLVCCRKPRRYSMSFRLMSLRAALWFVSAGQAVFLFCCYPRELPNIWHLILVIAVSSLTHYGRVQLVSSTFFLSLIHYLCCVRSNALQISIERY
jgi:hypothetical protein